MASFIAAGGSGRSASVIPAVAILPDDAAAAAEEIQRRREEIGFSYVVVGAAFTDTVAPVVAELAGR